MVFSYNWLQSFFKKKLPKPAKLAELLTIYSFEVEGIIKSGNDWILDIDVLPNRGGDCFSHLGIAKEISVITGLTYQSPISIIKEDKKLETKNFVRVKVQDFQICPRYTARVVTDIKVNRSPKWMEERLKNCGLRPINNIVDIVNYVMLETGQPLHAFDLDKIESIKIKNKKSKIKEIVVRKAQKNEKIITLDKEKYILNENILIIADPKEPLAIAGVKGGEKAEIDKRTKNVVLESANFDRLTIRQGSRMIGLRTEASWRFEQGLDPNLTELAINRAGELIQEIVGGRVAKGLIDIYPKKVLPKRIKLDLNYVEKLLGVKIPEREIRNILKRLGLKICKVQSCQLEIEVPTGRLDLSIPEDLIEEIGRIYGYQKIPSLFPITTLIPPKRNLNVFWEDMTKNILKEIGFTEVYNYSFVGKKEINIFQLNYAKSTLIEIENPISSDYQYLRSSLLLNLLKNVQKNQEFFNEIKIFELGKIFQARNEKRMLSGLITGDSFYQVKGVIDTLFEKLGISNFWYDSFKATPEESKISLWNPNKSAEIKVDHQEIGFLGEISKKVLEELRIKLKITAFDIDFEKLQKLTSEEHEFRPISPYPTAIRDLAILVPKEVLVEEVLNKIEEVKSDLIRDIDLFDIYEGEELPEEKKSLAFHIIYQAKDRTLSSKEIDEIQNKIIEALEKNPDWEVRK